MNIILNILTSGLPCCLLALGIFLTFRLLDFADLTCEGSFLIGGASTLALIANGVNPYLATLIGMIGGFICGIITGLLHTKLRIPKLLSGIITMTMTSSIALLIIGSAKEGSMFANLVTLSKNDSTIYSIFYNSFIPNQIVEIIIMIIFVIIVLLGIYYFFGTEVGMGIRATGMNEKMANSNGINVTFNKIICVGLSNALIGLSGSLWAQDARSIDVKSAAGFLVVGLAAILIGESVFGKKDFKHWIISVSLGGILYYVIVTLAIELGFPTQLKNLLYALLITISLCLPLVKSKLKGGKKYAKN